MNNWNWHPCTWHCDRLQVLHETDAHTPDKLKTAASHWCLHTQYTEKSVLHQTDISTLIYSKMLHEKWNWYTVHTHTWHTEKCCITQCSKRTHWHSVAQDLKPEQNIFQFYTVPVANTKPGKTLPSLCHWSYSDIQDLSKQIVIHRSIFSNMKQCTSVAVNLLAHLKQNPGLSIS